MATAAEITSKLWTRFGATEPPIAQLRQCLTVIGAPLALAQRLKSPSWPRNREAMAHRVRNALGKAQPASPRTPVAAFAAFPLAPAPMLALGFLATPQGIDDDDDGVVHVLDATEVFSAQWDTDYDRMGARYLRMFDVCRDTGHGGLVVPTETVEKAGISYYHAELARWTAVDPNPGSVLHLNPWWEELPNWTNNLTMTDSQITSTWGQGPWLEFTPYQGGVQFQDPGAFGWAGQQALNKLLGWGVPQDQALFLIDRIYDTFLAGNRFSPSVVLAQRTSLADLSQWMVDHGWPPIGQPPDDFIANPVIMREIVARRFPALAVQFTDLVIRDLLFLHDVTSVQRSFLDAVDRPTLESLLDLRRQYDQAVTNLTARVEVPDPMNDPGFVNNVVKALRKHKFALTSVPLTPIDDLSKALLDHGFGIPLFPLSTGPDWEEPIESPVVISAMLAARGFSITSQQVAELLKLHARPSVPASFVTTVSFAQLQTILNLHAQYVQLRDAILQQGILIEPDASALVGEFFQKEGHLNRAQGIKNETLIAHLVTALTGVTVTEQDVNTFETYFGLEDQITFDGILALPPQQVDEYINLVLKHLTEYQHLRDLGYTEGVAILIIREIQSRGIRPEVVETYGNATALNDYLASLGIIFT